MALRKITTIALWKNTKVGSGSAGGTSFSDQIDLRDINAKNNLSVSYAIAPVTGATCGSSVLSYHYSSVFDGTYVLGANFGTFGDSGGTGITAISSPPIMPFIKIKIAAGTSALTDVTGELHVQ